MPPKVVAHALHPQPYASASMQSHHIPAQHFTSGTGGAGGGLGNMFKIGQSNAKKITKEHVNVTFKDVAGVDEAKREIMEFVEILYTLMYYRKKLGLENPRPEAFSFWFPNTRRAIPSVLQYPVRTAFVEHHKGRFHRDCCTLGPL